MTIPCSGPNGQVDVSFDVTAALDKFKNNAAAPSKVRCEVEPAVLDFSNAISDVTFCLDAFQGRPYLFGPPPLPCP